MQLGNLEIQIREETTAVSYLFNGDVDEHFQPHQIPQIAKPLIQFYLAGVAAFNSCGIREWIDFVRAMGKLGDLHFLECSISMMDQINMIPQTLGNASIKSFYAPYFCKHCGEKAQLIEIQNHPQLHDERKAPSFNCQDCKHALVFDTLESSYLLFLNYRKRNEKTSA